MQVCDGGVRQTEFFSGVIALLFVGDGVIAVMGYCQQQRTTTNCQDNNQHIQYPFHFTTSVSDQ
ncbi:hypothetical protein RCO16_17285 [Escherichia coli]|nr:hypothetical protein [Escherichia coli]MED9701660.1 hypothetical protein [Escherichia coli]